MKLKKRAKELIEKFDDFGMDNDHVKQCALICANNEEKTIANHGITRREYYNDLRTEIEKI